MLLPMCRLLLKCVALTMSIIISIIFELNFQTNIVLNGSFRFVCYVFIRTSINSIFGEMLSITIALAYLIASVTAVPIGSEAILPRKEVLEEIVAPNQRSEIQHNDISSVVNSNVTNINICMTKGCVKASALVLDLIDENVDPCENFYEFACGKFIRNTFIPDDKIAMMSFVHVQDKVLDQLRLILNEKSQQNESKPFTLAKTFNAACMDLETLEREGLY